MPQRLDKIKTIVRELETELAALDTGDQDARTALDEALQDVRAVLRQVDASPLASESLIARFRAAEENFQVSHPTISGLVVRMIDALGQLGI